MIATLFVVLVGSYFAFNEQVKAADKMVVNEGETYTQTFQEAITQESITNGAVTILDAKGKIAKAVLSLDKAGKVLTVKNLPVGMYTLQVKSEAYVKGTKLQQDQQFSIEVVGKVKSISSIEDLKKYFETYLALEQAAYKSIENAVTTSEESSVIAE